MERIPEGMILSVCCQCQEITGLKDGGGMTGVSHTYCEYHFNQWMAETPKDQEEIYEQTYSDYRDRVRIFGNGMAGVAV